MSRLRRLLHPYELRDDDAAPGSGHASLAVRSHVAWHQLELDRDFAAGADTAASPEHEVRANQLLGRHVRRELAGCLDSVLDRADHRPHWHSTALPIQVAAVHAARDELKRLRDALLDDPCRSVRGVALASVLLHDDRSPVYATGEGSLSAVTLEAVAALTGEQK